MIEAYRTSLVEALAALESLLPMLDEATAQHVSDFINRHRAAINVADRELPFLDDLED